MAASLTHRNSATIVNKQQQHNWQNVSVPRRRPSDKMVGGGGGGGGSSSSFLVGVSSLSREVSGINLPTLSSSSSQHHQPQEVPIHKRPRSSDELDNNSSKNNIVNDHKREKKHQQHRREIVVGDASSKGGDYYSTSNSSSASQQQQQQQHVHKLSSSSATATTKKTQKVHSNISNTSNSSSWRRFSFDGSSSSNNKSEERRVSLSGDFKINSKTSAAERRSSIESVKSNTSSASSGSSGSGGFRRLKKFSSSSKKKASSDNINTKKESSFSALPEQLQLPLVHNSNKEVEKTATTAMTTSKKKKTKKKSHDDEDYSDDDDGMVVNNSTKKKKKKTTSTPTPTTTASGFSDSAAADSFQQTQLRLWKAAQERHQQLKRDEERKRLKKLQKKKLREQLQQERLLQKRSSSSSLEDDETTSSGKHHGEDDDQQQQQQRRESLDSTNNDNSSNSDDRGSTSCRDQDPSKSKSSSSSSSQRTATVDDEVLRAKKKLKKLKKMKKLQQQQEGGGISWSRSSVSNATTTAMRGKESSSSRSSMNQQESHKDDDEYCGNQANTQRTLVDNSVTKDATKQKVKKLNKLDPDRDSADTTSMKRDATDDGYDYAYDDAWKDKKVPVSSKSTRDSLSEGSASSSRRQSYRIGDRVSVYWSEDEQYYDAMVVKRRKDKDHPMPYKLEYDDGDIEWIDLHQHKVRKLKNFNQDRVAGEEDRSRSSTTQDTTSEGSSKGSSSKKKKKTSSSSRSSSDSLNSASRRRPSIQIGDRVSVYWSEDEQYYDAMVVKKRKDKDHPMPYKLEYDDGDIEWIDLHQHKFKFLDVDKAKLAYSSLEESDRREEERQGMKNKKVKKCSQASEEEDRKVAKLQKKQQEGDRVSNMERDCSESSSSATEEGEAQFAIGSSGGGDEGKSKMKWPKKSRRFSEWEEESTSKPGTTSTSMEDCGSRDYSSTKTTTTSSSLEATSRDVTKLKKMKRASSIEDLDHMPRKKKSKVDEYSHPDDGDIMKTPSTPDRKQSTIPSLAAVPLTPMSLGLADTVKTRVRSPAKARDELELLQAASFEKKKRKKNKDSNKDFIEECGNGDTSLKKKRKKKKKKQLLLMDSHVSDRVSLEATHPSSSKEKDQRWKAEDLLYDADVEAPSEAALESKGRKNPTTAETMSEVAWSETSSSTTVVTGKIKKKKKKQQRLKKLGSGDIVGSGKDDVTMRLEGAETELRRSEQPLPLKKRMAMAAAAAESASWEKNAALSTTASKVSLSSSGATPEFATEASSISEFTHPLGSMALPPPPPPTSTTSNSFHRHASVPREIVSKPPELPVTATSYELGVGANASVMGPSVSSSDESDSDSSCDSDTDEEELFDWANKMFGTSAKPLDEEEHQAETCMTETNSNLTPELCEMERRRQKQEEARTLSIKEVNAILQEEQKNSGPSSRLARHWVRRSVRQPSRGLLNTPLCRSLLDKLRGNDTDMVVLKMKKYLSDPDTPSMVIDAALEALEENTNCESLYIQNFNVGMKDKQVLHLLRILQQPSCNIWCLNIGETYNVSEDTWEEFAEGLKRTKVTHMYASEHTITPDLKEEIRDTIRWNRQKHNMHNDPKNLDVIIQCTHCWWNPINAKVLRPYLCKRGYESLLHDKEAQGLRGSMSEAPAD